MISHFMPLISFYNPWKHHKTRSFLKFSGGYRNRPVLWNRSRVTDLYISGTWPLWRRLMFLKIYKIWPFSLTPIWLPYSKNHFLYDRSLFESWIFFTITGNFRLSLKSLEAVFKKGVLENFAKFTRKHVLGSLFNKVAGLACNFIQKKSQTHVFSCEFCKTFKNIFFIEQQRLLHLGLLNFHSDLLLRL